MAQRQKIGVPRALFYYYYFPFIKVLLENLGFEVVLSPKTNKAIVDLGVKLAVDEVCLPVKIFYGHVAWLAERVDYVFLPRYVSIEKKAYICPKFLGIPDILKYSIPKLPPVIGTKVSLYKGTREILTMMADLGKDLGVPIPAVARAVVRANSVQKHYQKLLYAGHLPEQAMGALWQQTEAHVEQQDQGLTIGLIGHPYIVFDEHVSMNIITRLQKKGIRVVTPEMFPKAITEKHAEILPKRLFWTMGRKLIGAGFGMYYEGQVNGIIQLTAFGCGPDSFTGELLERSLRREGSLPLLNLTLDEHTGEAGVVTRLEAFLDMIVRRSRDEVNLSPHG